MVPDRIEVVSRSLAQGASRREMLKLVAFGVAGTAVTAVGLNETLAKNNGKGKNNGNGNNGGGKGNGNKGDSKNIGPFNRLTGIPLSAHDGGRNFKGTLNIVGFEERTEGIVALGTVTGKVTGKDVGNKKVKKDVVLPVSFTSPAAMQAQATCQILDLVLGPIDLNLLGLRLQVNQIHIQLTATQGALLGDLLCAIANLLNGGGALAQIVGLLNQILAALQGL